MSISFSLSFSIKKKLKKETSILKKLIKLQKTRCCFSRVNNIILKLFFY